MSPILERHTWKRVALGDVALASKEKCDPANGDVDRYVAGEHMDTDDLTIHRWGRVGDGYLGPAFHRRFRAGQVLYGSRRTYLRKVAVADFDGVCANTTFVIQPKDDRVLLPRFLPIVMTTEPFHAFAIAESKGSVNPYVNWSDIAKYEFDLPPIAQQQRIADLMWAIERTATDNAAVRRAISTARSTWVGGQVRQALERRSTAFRDLWSKPPESGWSAMPVDETTGEFVLSLAALGPDGYRPGQLKNVEPTPEVEAKKLALGDLLISRANTVEMVGRAAIFSEDRSDVSFPDTMMRIHLIPSVLPAFAIAVLMSDHGRRHMRRTAAGSATSMVKINRKSLGNLAFPDIALDEQRAIVFSLGVFDDALGVYKAEADQLRTMKSALAQLMLGESA